LSKHKSGWRKAAERMGRVPEAMPIVPSQWEVLLSTLGISEEDAAHSRKVREWCHKYRGNRFIHEAILESFGMKE